jgi:hypothetical protein
MTRKVVLPIVAGLTLALNVALATAQTIPLLGGVYQVSVTGSATQASFVPGVPFRNIQGFLYVLPPSITRARSVEMCLFVNIPPTEPPLFLTGSIWLASWLRCGSRLRQGGGPFTSLDTNLVGSVILSSDRKTIWVIPPLDAFRQQESFLVFENMFPTGQSTPNLVSGGWWGATTNDNGQTVIGSIQVKGYQSGLLGGAFGISLASYSATFSGTLITRLP